MHLHSILVCGAGTMGGGIAQATAAAGFPTTVYEPDEAALAGARTRLDAALQGLVDKQKLTPGEQAAILGRLSFTTHLESCRAEVVIEAVVENADVKVELFNRLAAVHPPTTIFASNTSSLSISALAQKIHHPGRVAGLHFFNPAPVMKLVEIVKGIQTEDAVVQTLLGLSRQLGKTPVVCKDAPGFIVNRVARPYYIESLRLAEAQSAGFAAIDRLLESRGFRMGPFRLMDLIGNDINYAVSCSVYEQLGRPERLRPSPLQQQKVESGTLGKKSKKGYYTYE